MVTACSTIPFVTEDNLGVSWRKRKDCVEVLTRHYPSLVVCTAYWVLTITTCRHHAGRWAILDPGCSCLFLPIMKLGTE